MDHFNSNTDNATHGGGSAAEYGSGGVDKNSNTSTLNPIFRRLNSGVDSAYVSYTGDLLEEAEDELTGLKGLAQSASPDDKALAQLKILEHIFEVRPYAGSGFAFGIKDNAFNIQISRNKSKLPLAYCQVSSAFIEAAGIKEVGIELDHVVAHLSDGVEDKLSRADLFVDFQTSVDLSKILPLDFITRCEDFVLYYSKHKFTGLTIGMGGDFAMRLYNKTHQLKAENIDRPELIKLWRENGWNGESDVWRLEFECKREGLVNYNIKNVKELVERQRGLWSYLTKNFIRLCIPPANGKSKDHRERWPVHPLWEKLQEAYQWGEDAKLKKKFSFAKLPNKDFLCKNATSPLKSMMALGSTDDLYQAVDDWLDELVKFHGGIDELAKYLRKGAANKRVQFCNALNKPREAEHGETL